MPCWNYGLRAFEGRRQVGFLSRHNGDIAGYAFVAMIMAIMGRCVDLSKALHHQEQGYDQDPKSLYKRKTRHGWPVIK